VKENEVVLFIPLGIYAFEQQLATALYLASQGGFRPHFMLIAKADHQFVYHLDAAGIPYSTLDPDQESGEVSVSVVSDNNLRWPKPRLRSLLKGFRWWRQLWLRKRVAKRLLRSLAPRCTIVSQERLHLFLPILKALRELRVPIILMPAAESSPDGCAWPRRKSWLLKAGLNNPPASPEDSPYPPLVSERPGGSVPGVAILNRGVQRWLPSQVYDSRWGRMLFYPAVKIFLLKIMGMLPRNPWYQGTTFADYIMISGIDEAAMYAEARVDPGKLLFYGSHELDVLYERWLSRTGLRQELIDDYYLDHCKSTLILSLPNLWEQGTASEEVHWQSINEILDVLSHQDCNVVISLHPSSNRSHYHWIEEKYPVKICREPLTDVLVDADIFVAAYSSTIRWAIGLGIPVINLDFWKLDYGLYRNLTGYQTVTTISEFDELVRRLASAPNNQGLNSGPSPASDRRGILVDGKAKDRLLSFIQSLNGAAAAPGVSSKHTGPVL
jgi:hypothetical protein